MTKITVFTPTYNRAHTLPALWQSLTEQTYTDFEWLLVDDGSTDGTSALLDEMVLQGVLNMRVVRTENGGKHHAINVGVGEAHGELFFIVDSDDIIVPDALEQIALHYEQVRSDSSFCGVCGLKAFFDGRKIGSPADFGTLDCTMVEFRHKYRMKGDMAEAFCTEILRRFPFPEYPGEKFVSEGLVWNRIAAHYKMHYFNRNIYLCEYLADGLTRSIARQHRKSPLGTMAYYAESAKLHGGTTYSKVKAAINYWRYTLNYKGTRTFRNPDGVVCNLRLPMWGYVFWPAGVFFYAIDNLG